MHSSCWSRPSWRGSLHRRAAMVSASITAVAAAAIAAAAPVVLNPALPAAAAAAAAPPAAHLPGGLSAVPSPSPQPGQLNTLQGLACLSAADCWAAGATSHINAPPGGYTRSLIERWDGRSWSVATSPPGTVTLSGVSCTSGSACLAVGYTNAIIAAAQGWNGARWRNLTPAKPSGSQYWLNAVSCGAAACEAVGGNPATGGLAERWNGTAWTLQEMPPSIAFTPDGVSCPAAASCWSVGFVAVTSDSTTPGIEHWNGTRWSRVN